MEKIAIGTGADFIDDVGLKVAVDGARNVFTLACGTNCYKFDDKEGL